MAGAAPGLIAKQLLAPVGGSVIEAVAGRLRGLQAQLIVEQRRKLGRDEIRRLADRQVDSRITEAAVTAHLTDANVGIPVGDGSIGRERLEPDTLEPVNWRNDDRQRWAVQRNDAGA